MSKTHYHPPVTIEFPHYILLCLVATPQADIKIQHYICMRDRSSIALFIHMFMYVQILWYMYYAIWVYSNSFLHVYTHMYMYKRFLSRPLMYTCTCRLVSSIVNVFGKLCCNA